MACANKAVLGLLHASYGSVAPSEIDASP